MLNIEVHYASSLDAAWDKAKTIAVKFFGDREYRLEYVEAAVSNDGGYFAYHEEPFTYDVTFQAKECSDGHISRRR